MPDEIVRGEWRRVWTAGLIVGALLFSAPSQGQAVATDSPVLDQVFSALSKQQEQLDKAAVRVNVTRQRVEGAPTAESARVAFSEDHYLYDVQQSSGSDRDAKFMSRRGAAWDGSKNYALMQLPGDVPTVASRPEDAAQGRLPAHLGQLLVNPLALAQNAAYGEAGSTWNLDKSAVRGIATREGSNLVDIDLDATAFSEYETLRLGVDLSSECPLVRIEQVSGGKVVSRMEADGFVKLSSGATVASGWKFTAMDTTMSAPGRVATATISVAPDADFQLDSPASFRFDYVEGLQDLESVLGALEMNRVSRQVAATIPKAVDSETALPVSPAAAAPAAAPEQAAKVKAPAATPSAPVAVKPFGWRMLAGMIFLCTLLVAAVALAWAALYAKTDHTIVVTKRFVSSAVVAVLLLSVVVFAETAKGLQPIPAVREAGLPKVSAATPARPAEVKWPVELVNCPYRGIAYKGGMSFPYEGVMTRRNGTEVHEWTQGSVKQRIVMEDTVSRFYRDTSPQPIASNWAPCLYSIISKYNRYFGTGIGISGSPSPVSVDLSPLHFLDSDLKTVLQKAELRIAPGDAGTWNVEVLAGGTVPRMKATISITGDTVKEEYTYFDGRGNPSQKMGMEYSPAKARNGN